jgi:hypothetical protein
MSETFQNPRVFEVNFIPNSYPHNSLISEKIEIRELFTACQPVPATVKGASFQKFKHLNLAASFSNDDVSSKPSSFIIMTRYYRGSAFNSWIRNARLFSFWRYWNDGAFWYFEHVGEGVLKFWNTFTVHSLTFSRSLSLSSIVAFFLSSFLSLNPLFLLFFFLNGS